MDYFTLVVPSGILLYKSRGGNPIGINISAKSDDPLSLKKKSMIWIYITYMCSRGRQWFAETVSLAIKDHVGILLTREFW